MRKEIYVSDADAELIAEVQALSDEESLSAIVVKALRSWLGMKRQAEAGFELRELQPGRWPEGKTPLLGQPLKFVGKLLAEYDYGELLTVWRVFQTKAGKIVVERRIGAGFAVDESEEEIEGPVTRVAVFEDIDRVPHSDDPDDWWPGSDSRGVGEVPDLLWKAAKSSLGAIEPKWID